MSVIAFSSVIGPVPISCILTEKHESGLEITLNPVEFGADITDHAYVRPKRVTLDIADAGAALTYNDLVRFQESRVPFTLVTGLSLYRNMLIKSLDADRDASFSRVLRCKVELQEIIIVDTAYAAADGSDAPQAGKPGGEKSTQAARPTKGRAGDAATADRASGTVQRGDAPASAATPKEQTVLKKYFG